MWNRLLASDKEEAPLTVPEPKNDMEIILKCAHDPGEGKRIGYIVEHYRLSPKLDNNACVKLYCGVHLRAIMYGYQINKALGN
jgi:hypothetical protein